MQVLEELDEDITAQTEDTVGPVTVNFTADDVAGPGFCAATVTFPAEVSREESTMALSCVALMTVVGNWMPFQSTVEPVSKLLPATIS
jgi:hypothetical protein